MSASVIMGARCTPAAQWMKTLFSLLESNASVANSTPRWKNRRRLRLEVVIHGVPQHLHAIRPGQRGVVELDLHVDDVCYAGLDHLHHLRFGPDAAADRDAVGDPGHVHASRATPKRKIRTLSHSSRDSRLASPAAAHL